MSFISGLWGGGKNKGPESFGDYVPQLPTAGGGGGGGASNGSGGSSYGDKDDKKKGAQSVYSFDSTALERAAAAAKELENTRKLSTYSYVLVCIFKKLLIDFVAT